MKINFFVVSLDKELVQSPLTWEIFSVCLIILDSLEKISERFLVTDFMSMFGFSIIIFLLLFFRNKSYYYLEFSLSGIYYSIMSKHRSLYIRKTKNLKQLALNE